ncbi:GATA-type domain-containing protein [Trichostrongylus colubriformis]|uniref:GATA-type domain-containing protein n=1 Tax=Trichostrongylus colubriformis TaxID=6319 RepID=A0AAN8IYV3_TRICO
MQRVSTAPSLLIQSHLLQKPSSLVRTTSSLQKSHGRRVSTSVDVAHCHQKLLQTKRSSNSDGSDTHKVNPNKASEGLALKTSTNTEQTSMTSPTDGQEAPSPSVRTTTENDLQIDVTDSADTSKTSSSLLTPPSEDDQDSKPSPAQSSCGGVQRKRKSNGFRKTDESVRKSGRITRTCDPSAADFVDNYVDSKRLKQPRVVQPPKGAKRIPNVMPRNKGAKEKDKLSIDMVGPRTRSSLVELISPLGGTRRRNTHIELSAKIGPEHQATFEPFYACDFVVPSVSSVDEEPDRDEPIWHVEPSGSCPYTEEELDDAWMAVRCQYGGNIGLDSMLYCLMKHNYSIDAMLENIEMEQWDNLSQPFEELNIAQQREFERVLRDLKGKNFGAIQDKFMRQYYLGEITQYYYQSKRRACVHERYTRCLCRERLSSATIAQVPRYECANCSKYLWEGKHRPPKYCAVCQLYYKRNGHHRNVVGKLFETDEKIVRRWIELEKDNKRTMSSEEVLEWLETERREAVLLNPDFDEIPTHPAKKKLKNDQIMDLTQKFKPTTNPRCALLTDYGNVVSRVALEGFREDEILQIIRAFKKVGKKFNEVSNIVGTRTPQEISIFYRRYKLQYHLDALFESSRKALLPPIIAASTSRSLHPENGSSSPTPEPVPRRRRAGSDPAYPEADVAPVKTTRVTRQSAASVQKDTGERELNGRVSPRSVSLGDKLQK